MRSNSRHSVKPADPPAEWGHCRNMGKQGFREWERMAFHARSISGKLQPPSDPVLHSHPPASSGSLELCGHTDRTDGLSFNRWQCWRAGPPPLPSLALRPLPASALLGRAMDLGWAPCPGGPPSLSLTECRLRAGLSCLFRGLSTARQASLLGLHCPSRGGRSRPAVPLLSSGSETSRWECGVWPGGSIDATETGK